MQNDSYNQLKEENTNTLSKLFLLEQELIKKNNVIAVLKKRIQKENPDDREIYIIEPSQAVVQINDELLSYKEHFEKTLSNIKKNQLRLKKYDNMISSLRDENYKLKTQFKLQVKSANRERETMLSLITQNTKFSDNVKNSPQNRNLTTIDNSRLTSKYSLGLTGRHYSDSHEEFGDVLRNCGLTIAEFERFAKNRSLTKVTEVVEMLFKLLTEKNMTISLLETENDNLNAKNFQLNKENMALSTELANKNKNTSKNDVLDDTLSNNASQITVNKNLNIASLLTYQKLLEKQQEENENPEADLVLSFSESSIQNSKTSKLNYFSSSRQSNSISQSQSSVVSSNTSHSNNSVVDKRMSNKIDSILSNDFKVEMNN